MSWKAYILQYNTGWRFKKRPGIDYFLSQVAPPLFEVVIYSQEQGMVGDIISLPLVFPCVCNPDSLISIVSGSRVLYLFSGDKMYSANKEVLPGILTII